MQISVTGKQLDVSEAFRERVEERLGTAVSKYFDGAIDGHVTVSRDGGLFRTDCSVHVGHGIHVKGQGNAGDAYASFEDAVGRVGKQLRRYKRRLRSHHAKQREQAHRHARAMSYVLAAEERTEAEETAEQEGRPVIVAENSTEIPSCSVGEAVMRMDLADLPLVLFHNSAHGGINVVYRRADGNVGWIEPKAPAK